MKLDQINKMDGYFLNQSQHKNQSFSRLSESKVPEYSPVKQKIEYQTQGFQSLKEEKNRKQKVETKTKWDSFCPYAFSKLSENQKVQSFLQLFDDYQSIKIKLNEQIDKNKHISAKLHHLESQINKLKSEGKPIMIDKIKYKNEENQENRLMKEEIKRLHEKILALTKNTSKNLMQRPQSAAKHQKAIFPVNQNIRGELELERKQVRQLLLIVDELKNNKFSLEYQLKERQQNQPATIVPQKINKNIKDNSESQFQNYAYDLQTWKDKYYDMELCCNRMSEDKDRKIKQLEAQKMQLQEDERMKRTTNTYGKTNQISINILEEKNRDLIDEKEKLQSEIRRLVQMPFNQSNRGTIQLQDKYTKLQIAFAKIKDEFNKTREQSSKYYTELEYKTRQAYMVKNENEKLKKQVKEALQKQNFKQNASNEIDYDDYYRKLLNMVKLEGEDPIWRKYENLVVPSFTGMKEEQLRNQVKLMWNSKLELLAHLEKAQVELKMIKQSTDSRVNLYVKEKEYIEEELRVARAKLDQWQSMEKVTAHRQNFQLFEQAGVKYDDTVSVFQADESQLKELQENYNYFDLYLGQLNLDESTIMHNPQNKIRNIASLISFLTIDFYNHDTQHSNFVEGNSKKVNNNYSFKVEMNSYLIKFLTKNTITLQLWSPQGTATVLIGKGEIWLKDLVSNSVKDISAVLRGKCPIYYGDRSLIGTIQYRLRMRLPIGPYLEWAHTADNQKSKANQQQDFLSITQKKRLSIQVTRATNLPEGVNAFVYFNFQEQDFFTEPVRGPQPFWDYHQEINVLLTEELSDYLRQNYIQFTIFDDEKEVNHDVIGIAKASFTKLISDVNSIDLELDIKNEVFEVVGKLKVKASWI